MPASYEYYDDSGHNILCHQLVTTLPPVISMQESGKKFSLSHCIVVLWDLTIVRSHKKRFMGKCILNYRVLLNKTLNETVINTKINK